MFGTFLLGVAVGNAAAAITAFNDGQMYEGAHSVLWAVSCLFCWLHERRAIRRQRQIERIFTPVNQEGGCLSSNN